MLNDSGKSEWYFLFILSQSYNNNEKKRRKKLLQGLQNKRNPCRYRV